MTFLEMQNSTAYYLDDLAFGYFTPTQVKVWLNNAQKRVQKRLIKAGQSYYNLCSQTTLIKDQREYILPNDFKKLMRLELVTSGVYPNENIQPIVEITTNQKDLIQNSGRGTPCWYTFKRNRLVIYPAPDTALVMKMEYAYEVADMVNDSDLPDVLESYHELIPLLAAEDGFLKDGRVSEILAKKLKEFNEELDQDAQERNQDSARGIVETGTSPAAGFYW